MSTGPESHVSVWIARLKEGDRDAARRLWSCYSDRLFRLAKARLRAIPRMSADRDEEDIAQSAFRSFCNGVDRGRFPRLNDREDFWRLLVFIVRQKVHDRRRYVKAPIRDPARTIAEAVDFDNLAGVEDSPEIGVMVAEECKRLLDRLDNDQLRQIAIWKMEGYTNEEIAIKLGSCLKTVSNKLKLIRMSWSDRM